MQLVGDKYCRLQQRARHNCQLRIEIESNQSLSKLPITDIVATNNYMSPDLHILTVVPFQKVFSLLLYMAYADAIIASLSS